MTLGTKIDHWLGLSSYYNFRYTNFLTLRLIKEAHRSQGGKRTDKIE